MKVLHLNAGNETGGGMVHILSLLKELNTDEMILGVFEKGAMYTEAKKHGINVICFDQTSRFNLSILKEIARYVKNEQIDIVHTHGARANLYGFLLKKVGRCHCKWITTIHSDPRDDFLGGGVIGKVYTKLNLLSIRTMDHYFAISTRFKEMLKNFGVDDSFITTIYNGINFDVPAYVPITRQQICLAKDDFVITMIARLHPVKGHIVAFEALKELIHTNKNIKLLLIGDGPLEDDLKKLADEMGISNHVLFQGYQENIHGYLSITDVMILTSYSESFPLVILEASRAHVPVISTDVGGVKDLITDSSLGWVIPQRSSEALNRSIQEAIILKDDGALKFIGLRLYDKASKEYNLKNFSNSVYNAYKEIMEVESV